MGIFAPERLQNHLKTTDLIYWHPNRAIPGIEFHSGSLGHLLPVSLGIALDCKMRKQDNKIVVITGDGELNEGTNWEALLVAGAYHLGNLVVIVDRNRFQANIETEKLIPLEPLLDKFTAFGCECLNVDGHDFVEMHGLFSQLPLQDGKPHVVIANTVRGKGLPSIERRADRWFCNFSKAEIEQLKRELHGENEARLTSETLMVR
jgi:transketolase